MGETVRQAGRQRNERGKAGRHGRQGGLRVGRQAGMKDCLVGLWQLSHPARPWTVPVEMASEERWG